MPTFPVWTVDFEIAVGRRGHGGRVGGQEGRAEGNVVKSGPR